MAQQEMRQEQSFIQTQRFAQQQIDRQAAAEEKRRDQVLGLEVAKAEFAKATAPETMTDTERSKLEADFTTTRQSIAAEAAAKFQADVMADPTAQETEGGFLGIGSTPTAAAVSLQNEAARFNDPSKLSDEELEAYRSTNPAAFAKLDETKAKLADDAKRREQRTKADLDVAVARARKAGYDPFPQNEDPEVGIARIESEVERGNAKLSELQQRAKSGAPMAELAGMMEEMAGLQSELARKTELAKAGRDNLAARAKAATVSTQAQRQNADIPPVAVDAAKKAAVATPDGAFETSQVANLAALVKDGQRVYFRQEGATTAVTPEARKAKAEEAASTIAAIKEATTAKTIKLSEQRDRLQSLVSRGKLTQEDATAQLEALYTGDDAGFDAEAEIVNQKLDSAVQDFFDGNLDAGSLDAMLHAAGSPKTSAEVVTEAAKARRVDDIHVNAIKPFVGDGQDAKRMALSQQISAAVASGEPSEELRKQLSDLRDQRRSTLSAELTKRGVDLAEQPRLIARAELEAVSQAGILETVEARGGVLATIGGKLPFVGGAVEAVGLLPYAETAMKMELGEPVNADEMEAFTEFIRFSGKDTTFATKVADVITALPGFVVELATTGGIATAVKKGGLAVLKEALMKAATKEGKERIAKATAEAVARKFGKDAPKRYAAWRIGSGLAQEAIRAPFSSASRMYAGYVRDQATDAVRLDEQEGKIVAMMDTEARKGGFHRFADSYVDSVIENVSERSGAYLASGLGTAARSVGLGGAVDKIRQISADVKSNLLSTALVKSLVRANPDVPIGKIGRMLKGANIGGTFEEMGEERLGSMLRDIYTGTTTGNWELTLPSVEDLAVEMVAFSVPSAVSGIQTARHFSKLDKALSAADADVSAQMEALMTRPEALEGVNAQLVADGYQPLTDELLKEVESTVGDIGQTDVMRQSDEQRNELVALSDKAIAAGDLEKGSRLRQRAVMASRSRSDILTAELGRAGRAVSEIQAARTQAEALEAQAAAMPDGDPGKEMALAQAQGARASAERAGALVKIARGREALLTAAESEALKPIKGQTPFVVAESGQQIITDAGIAELKRLAPTAATYIKSNETERREQLANQAQPNAVPAPTNQPGTENAPTPQVNATPAATQAPTSSGVATAPSRPTTSQPVGWQDRARNALTRLKDPERKKNVSRTIDTLSQVIEARGAQFPGGVELTADKVGAGLSFDKVKKSLRVNPVRVANQTSDLDAAGLTDYLDRVVSEEIIHAASTSAITDEEAAAAWQRLSKSKEGKKLQTDALRAYNSAYERDGREAPKLTDANNYHELLRMAIQSTDFRARVTEAANAVPGIKADLMAFLQRIADYITANIAKLPKPQRAALESDLAKVRNALQELGVRTEAPAATTPSPESGATGAVSPVATNATPPILTGPQTPGDAGAKESAPDSATAPGSGKVATGNKITVIALKNGSIVHVRSAELADPNATTLRAFTEKGSPIRGEAGKVNRADIMTDPTAPIVTPVDQAANEAATSPVNDKPQPTEAMKKAGNYELGHTRISGMDISIENPAGSIRSGKDKDGETWQVEMKAHYGYIKGTEGKDGDHIDIFIESGTPEDFAGPVYVVNQMRPIELVVQPLGGGGSTSIKTSDMEFDEHKAVMGPSIATEEAAKALYLSNYSPGWQGAGTIARFPDVATFKAWATERQRRAPAKTPKGAVPEQTAEEKAAEAMRSNLKGLFSAPRVVSDQQDAEYTPARPAAWEDKDIPEDRIPGIMATTKLVFEAGIRTPEDFAAFMERTFPGGGSRPYVAGIWQIMGGMKRELRTSAIPDWAAIYSGIDGAAADSVAVEKGDFVTWNEGDQTLTGTVTYVGNDGKAMIRTNQTEFVGDIPIRRNDVIDVSRLSKSSNEPPAEPLTGLQRLQQSVADESRKLADGPVDFKVLKKRFPEMPAKDFDEAVELGLTQGARDIVLRMESAGEEPQAIFNALVEFSNRQPTLGAKTSTSKINQAYSTPAPMAYLASRLGDVKAGTIIEERTAGNGMLLIERQSEQVILANELDPKRRERLQAQGIAATGEDATTWEPAQRPDRVIANPPFGQVMESGGANRVFDTPAGQTTAIDHAIVLKSLETLQDDGRAVFIIGGPPPTVRTPKGRAEFYRGGKKGDFYSHLYQNFNVIEHFTIPGDLYAKQGAGWPVDVIVVAGKGRSPLALPGRKAPRIIETWEALGAELNRTDNERIESNRLTEADLRKDADTMVAQLEGLGGVVGQVDETPANGGELPQVSDRGGNAGTANRSPRNRRVVSEIGNGDVGPATASDSVQPTEGREENAPSGDVQPTGTASLDVGSEYQTAYAPISGVNPAGLLSPVNLATPMREALTKLSDEVGDLKSYVTTKLGYPANTDITKFFFGDQIDALAQAVYNVENGGALVIGDQTGAGKGRIAAGLMKYAVNRGLVPVFFTKDPTLYDAMLDDLKDIEAPEILPALTNNDFNNFPELKARMKEAGMPSGQESFEEYNRTGKLPKGANAVFTSYSQIASDDRPGLTKAERAEAKKNEEPPPDYWRMEALRSLAPNALMILDESHIASGASTTGWRLADLLRRSPNVYYSSATFAKRPDNMGLYFRTNLGQVAGNLQDLMAVMKAGGVPAMQVASSMLARDGQYMRRERSFAGVRFETFIANDTYERDKMLADNYTEGLRAIVEVQDRMNKAADAVNQMVASAGKRWQVPVSNRARLESQNFSAKLHNMVRQYLFAIKSLSSARMAVKAIKEGVPDASGNVRPHKVIVAVDNTMESAIKELRERGFPLTFNGMLDMYLEQQREFVVKGGAFGREKETWTLPKTGNPEFEKLNGRQLQDRLITTGRHPTTNEKTVDIDQAVLKELVWRAMNSAFTSAQAQLEKLQLADMPVSPIDAMRQLVEAEGIRTGEMTGRSVGIDSNGEVYERSASEKKGRMKAKDDFNNSDLHFLVINKSGSTGVSMHASEKFADRRPRMMMVVQPNLDINEFMQTLGRIHRAGQVELPSYVVPQTALPAEKRPAAILGTKMAMLNANTTSNADSEVSQKDIIDVFNKYGDEVTWSYLSKNPGLVTMINKSWSDKLVSDGKLKPLADFQSSENGGEEGYLTRSVTGHLAILPVDEQEAFWDAIEADYRALIAYLDQMGQNDLRATVLDMKAKTVSQTLYTGGGTDTKSVFAEPSWIETVDTKMGRKPMEAADVIEMAKPLKAEATKKRDAYLALAEAWVEKEDKRKAVVQNKWEEKRENWIANQEEAMRSIASAIGMIGTFGAYKRSDDTFGYAMLRSINLDENKPTTPSLQTARIVINDSRYEVTVALTKLPEFFSSITYGEAEQWARTYDFGSTRSIITGNLLSALPTLEGKGQIISFTTAEGSSRMGILLPTGFTKDMQKREGSMDPVADAERFIDRLSKEFTVSNPSKTLRFAGGNGMFFIYAPSSRAAGGKYWRDPALNALLEGGEFAEVQGTMNGIIPRKNLEKVFNYLTGNGETFMSAKDGKRGEELASAPRIAAAPTPFYSKLAQVIDQKMPSRADSKTIAGLISNPQTGIKAEELKWSGILPWLEGQTGPITKADVLDYLETDGAVTLEEVRISGEKITRILPDENGGYSAYAGNTLVQRGLTLQQAEQMELRPPGGKYAQYQLPGGENYREVVLAMPEQSVAPPFEEWAKSRYTEGSLTDPRFGPRRTQIARTQYDAELATGIWKQGNYTSNHFTDVPNYVAHMRLNDRTDADGKAGTFIEEIQSDRHQAGRKNGYQLTDEEREREWRRIVAIPAENRSAADVTLLDRMKEELRTGGNKTRTGVPDAPFRKDWPLQMFKRALADAVAAGKSWIGWTTGETQNERFDLSKQVRRVKWETRTPGKINGVQQPDNRIISVTPKSGDVMQFSVDVTTGKVTSSPLMQANQYQGKSLDEVIGKDMAERIMAEDSGDLSGDGLKVGGSGMKGFYDNMLPKEIGKYVKQWGASVEKSGIPHFNGPFQTKITTPIWRVDITPQMKAGVQSGQALFSAPRLGIDDPEFAETMDYLNSQIPDLDGVLERAGYNWNRTYTEEEIVPVVAGVRKGMRTAYDDQLDRQKHEEWNEEARRLIAKDKNKVIRDLAEAAARGEILANPVQVKAAMILAPELTARALVSGDQQALLDTQSIAWSYDIAGTEIARSLAARHQPGKTPEERNREVLSKAIFTPGPQDRANIERAPSPGERSRKIKALEAELAKVRADAMEREKNILTQVGGMTANLRKELFDLRKKAKAEIQKLRDELEKVKASKDKLTLLAEANKKRLKDIEQALGEMGVTFQDLFVDKSVVAKLKSSTLMTDTLAKFNEKERLSVKLRMEGRSDRHIADKLKVSVAAVKAMHQRFDSTFDEVAGAWVDRGFSVADLDGSTDLSKIIDDKGNLLASAVITLTPEQRKERIAALRKFVLPISDEARATGVATRRPKNPETGEYGFDMSRPEHTAMLLRSIQRLDSTAVDAVYEYWINGLLSGPKTHTANLIGNFGSSAWEYAVQRPVETLVNSIILRDAAGPQAGEYASMAKYLGEAVSTAWRYAKIAWNTEVSLFDHQWMMKPINVGSSTGDKGQVQRFAIKGTTGRVIRMPSRFLQFSDEFAKHLIGQLEAAAQAHRLAKADGLTGEAFDKRVDQLVKTPGSPAWLLAVDQAHKLTFSEDLPPAMQKLQDALHQKAKTPQGAVLKTFLRFVFPFIKTPYNIFKTGLRKTPIGGLRMVGKGIAAYRSGQPFFDSYPKAALAQDIAEQMLAWMATVMLWGIAEGDPDDDKKLLLFTGSRSLADNRGEDQLLNRTKGGETSILWNGKPIFNYGRIEPFATVIASIVDAARNMKAVGQGRATSEAFDSTWRGFLNQARSKTFLQGLEGLMSLVEGHKNLSDSAVKAVAQGMVPNLVRQPVRSVDEFARDSRNAPWYYQAMPLGGFAEPLYDLYGRPIEKAGNPLLRVVADVPTRQLPVQAADKALQRYNLENPNDTYFPTQPDRATFRYKTPAPGVDAKGKPKTATVDMTPREAAAYRAKAGQQFASQAATLFPFGASATPKQIADLKSARDKTFRETKEQMFPGRAPVLPARQAPTIAELFGIKPRTP